MNNARVEVDMYALCLSKDQKWRRVMLHYVWNVNISKFSCFPFLREILLSKQDIPRRQIKSSDSEQSHGRLCSVLGADIIYSSGEARREKETLAPPILLFGLFLF